MAPGEASYYDQMVLLGNPYPENAMVAVHSMTSQMVDDMGNPVTLSEVGEFVFGTCHVFPAFHQ